MHAIGGHHTVSSGGVHFSFADSTEVASTGNHVTDHNDGNHYVNMSNDFVTYIGGTKYESIGGEYGIHLTNGNMDIKLDNGNYQINSSANVFVTSGAQVVVNASSNILITSLSGVTIKVGSQSIVITTSGITFNGSAISFNQV